MKLLLTSLYSHRLQMTKPVVRYLTLSADEGLMEAQNEVGWAYLSGYFVEKDPAQAAHYFAKAAAQGHLGAKTTLAGLRFSSAVSTRLSGGCVVM